MYLLCVSVCVCVLFFYISFFIFDICAQEQTKHITHKMTMVSEWKKINEKKQKRELHTEMKRLLQKSSFHSKWNYIALDITCANIPSIAYTYFAKYSIIQCVQMHSICGHNPIHANGNQFKIKHHCLFASYLH